MFKKLLELSRVHGDHMTVEILEQAGIAKKELPRILHDIIAKNDEANIAMIIPMGSPIIDLYYLNEEGLTPIQVAVKLKRWDHVLAIVSAEYINHTLACTGYALLEAVKANEAYITARILKYCKDLNFQCADNGYTALHVAIANNNEVILRALLAAGIDANLPVRQTVSPLQMVLRAKVINPKLISLLCQHGAEIDTIVMLASVANDWALVQFILENDKRQHPVLLSELLFEAVSQNNQAMVAYAFGKGGNFTHLKNALQRALNLKYYHFVKFAVESVPAKDLPLDKLLPILAQAEQWELVTKIMQAKPLFNATVNYNATIHILIAKAKWDILELLLQQGADVNLQNGDNKTALEMAVSQGAAPAVVLLCQHGADVAAVITSASQQKRWNDIKMILDCDKRNHGPILTPVLVAAAQAAETEIVNLLLLRGSSIEEAIKLAAENQEWLALRSLITALPPGHSELLTPLLSTVINYDLPELLTLMLERGASAIIEIHNKKTAVQFAAEKLKWHCVEAIAVFLQSDPDDKARLGDALLSAAAVNEWGLVKTLCNKGAHLSWRKFDTGKFAVHMAIEANQIEVLSFLLAAKFDVHSVHNEFESALECAERVNRIVAKNLLIQYGANHHNKLIREATKANWDGLLNLISEHYEIRPNQNETEDDKKIILGKLLHFAVTKKSLEAFRALLLLKPDVLQQYDNKNLLSLIIKEQALQYLDLLIAENLIQQFSKQAVSLAMAPMFTGEGVKFHIIQRLCPYADLSYVDPATGNSFVHWTIIRDTPNTLKELITNHAPTNIKNAEGKFPKTLLLYLIKAGKVKNGDRLVACFPDVHEYADALEFESRDENLGEDNIKKSRDFSRAALLRRYPNLDVETAIKVFRIFIGHLPDKYQDYKNNSEYKLDDPEVRKDIALAWVAACDANALPECEAAIKSDPERVKAYVELRKLALAEKLYQAKVETREGVGSCGNGTKTKAIEALNHAHPDVMICYSKSLTEQSAREHALPIILKKSQELFQKMTFKNQRAFAKEYFSEDDDNNEQQLKLYQELSASVEAELKPLYGEILPGDELKKLVAVERLQEIEFTPIRELSELIFKIRRLNTPESADLKQQALNAFAPERDESLFAELERLKKGYQTYTDKVSAQQLANFSVLNQVEKKNEEPTQVLNQETPKTDSHIQI